jgi:putative DNA methylase
LASSIVLVCRPRDPAAPEARRDEFIRSLRRELRASLANLTTAGVPIIDLGQALVGPGLGVYSKFRSVASSDGCRIQVAEALRIIAQVRSELHDGTMDYDGETRFALDWFAAKGFDKGKSSDAITMCNAVNGSLDGMNATGFFEAKGGDARLLKRDELPDDWDPAEDDSATVWEACQHLIKRLTAEDGGTDAAAALYSRLGALSEPARALARRLYDICEQKQWAAESYVYNQLHQEWETIEKRAGALAEAGSARDLFSR